MVTIGGILLALLSAGAPAPEGAVLIDGDPSAKEPQVALDGRGRVFVAYGKENEVRVASSADGGKTFGEPVSVGRLPAMALGMRRGPRVAATADAVVVTAVGGREGKGKDGDLFAWRSTDGGASWTGPERVNDVEGSAREGLHAMAGRPDGTVFATWLDLRAGKMELYGATSRDGGASWEEDRLVYRSPDGAICTCCHPSAAFGPDGSLAVMWRNDLAGARDMYLVRSEDGGSHFGKPQKLGRRIWLLDKCPMDGGAIAFDSEGMPNSVWMRADQSFASAGSDERLLGDGVQPWAAGGREGVHMVWLRRRPGALLYLAPGADSPRTLASSANDPVVGSAPGSNGPVVAAWERSEEGGRGIVATVLEPGGEASGSRTPGER